MHILWNSATFAVYFNTDGKHKRRLTYFLEGDFSFEIGMIGHSMNVH